jgi:hypothetical protein
VLSVTSRPPLTRHRSLSISLLRFSSRFFCLAATSASWRTASSIMSVYQFVPIATHRMGRPEEVGVRSNNFSLRIFSFSSSFGTNNYSSTSWGGCCRSSLGVTVMLGVMNPLVVVLVVLTYQNLAVLVSSGSLGLVSC